MGTFKSSENCQSHSGKPVGTFNKVAYTGIHNRNSGMWAQETLYESIHSGIDHNSLKLETTPALTNSENVA